MLNFIRSLAVAVFLMQGVQGIAQTSFAPLEIGDSARIVLIGDTLIEREQTYGHFEASLHAQFPGKKFLVRNLGWSGDTPEGISRLSFDFGQTNLGLERIAAQIKTFQPTLVFVGYGMASSFDGERGLDQFRLSLNRLVDRIGAESGNKVEFIFLGPLPHLKTAKNLPDGKEHQLSLNLYNDAIKQLAQERKSRFISLFAIQNERALPSLTDNGIHLTDKGYQALSRLIGKQLGWSVKLEISEELRQAVIEKNVQFFNRWRPQNETYLFGFRKHEQGQNAREIPMFDPIIAAAEEKIQGMARAGVSPKKKARPQKPSEIKVPTAPVRQDIPFFETDPNFTVELFAENPLLAKPIQMNFDADGRLWVASSAIYPQIAPGQKATDQVVVIEDLDHDGKADKSTVFADGLLIPTGVEPGDGGVYVGQSTELLHFKDTDGDGRADQRKIILSGFGTEDTHHILHTLRWGFDGRLYFNQSIYIHSHLETPQGVKRLNSGGIWRLDPASMELDVFLKGFCNPWGHHFDPYGQSFVTDGAGYQGISHAIPGATYFTYSSMRREMKSVSPGNYPKYSGLEMVRSPVFPKEYQGDLVTCDFRAHRVVRFSLSDQGAGYVTQEKPDFARTTNVNFRPIDAKFGPDGALYIADWSNPIIQHGEVDFRDPRRDHANGRIWRIKAKNQPVLAYKALSRLPVPELLPLLLSENGFEQEKARRVLIEKGSSVLKPARSWAAKAGEKAKLENLWLQQAFGLVEEKSLREVLSSSNPDLRSAGVRVLSETILKNPQQFDELVRLSKDSHPRVRLEVIRAVGRVQSESAARLLFEMITETEDRFLEYATWLSVNELEPFLSKLIGNGQVGADSARVRYVLGAIEPDKGAALLARIFKPAHLKESGNAAWIQLVGQVGGVDQVSMLVRYLREINQTDPQFVSGMDSIARAIKVRGIKAPVDAAWLGLQLKTSKTQVQIAALQIIGAQRITGFSEEILALALRDNSSENLRKAAFEALREGKENGIKPKLQSVLKSNAGLGIKKDVLSTIFAIDPGAVSRDTLDLLRITPGTEDALQIWRLILSQRGISEQLTSSLSRETEPLPKHVAETGLKAARESGRKDQNLILALSNQLAKNSASTEADSDAPTRLALRVNEGNPANGENVYRRPDLGCVSCHAIGGAGGKVGPDLTSIGASAPADYLIESLLFPNKKIKEGYHSLVVQTTDEQEMSGVLVRESADELVLRNAANQEQTIPKKRISKRQIGLSLMPSGLIESLPLNEQLDLYRFLSELGKPGVFDASKGDVARSWSINPLSTDKEQFGLGPFLQIDPKVGGWIPLLSRVDGTVSKAEIEQSYRFMQSRGILAVFAGAVFETTKEGSIAMEISGLNSGAEIWIDGKSASIRLSSGKSGSILENLKVGRHKIVLKLDPKNLPDQFSIRIPEARFLNE